MRPITHGKSRFSLLFALLSALVLLAGCAGGGGGPDAPPPDQSAQRLLAAGQSQYNVPQGSVLLQAYAVLYKWVISTHQAYIPVYIELL